MDLSFSDDRFPDYRHKYDMYASQYVQGESKGGKPSKAAY